MTQNILNWEATQQVNEALVDGLSDEQLQSILDIIYGKNMFNIIDAETLKKQLFENKEVMALLNKTEQSEKFFGG